MRLFAGIPVPEPALSGLATILNKLQSHGWPVRWVRPEGLHLTLKFLGPVDESKLPALAAALDSATDGMGPMPLTGTELGTFPSGSRAKVIWIGLDAPGALELLQDRVERACVPLGYPVEGRPFRPHITLGRVKDAERLPAAGIPLLAGVETAGDISFLADRVVLFQSQPGPGGSVYLPRHTVALSACAAA